jgi:hypothetical protein
MRCSGLRPADPLFLRSFGRRLVFLVPQVSQRVIEHLIGSAEVAALDLLLDDPFLFGLEFNSQNGTPPFGIAAFIFSRSRVSGPWTQWQALVDSLEHRFASVEKQDEIEKVLSDLKNRR